MTATFEERIQMVRTGESRFTGRGGEAVFLGKTTGVNFSDHDFTPQDAKILANALRASPIEWIVLGGKLTDEDLKTILEALPTNIKSLYIAGLPPRGPEDSFDINVPSFSSLPTSPFSPVLKTIGSILANQWSNKGKAEERQNLSEAAKNDIGPKSLSALKQVLMTTNIENLSIRRIPDGFDGGAKIIAQALPHSKLRELYLTSCAITDEGAGLLASTIPYSQLSRLALFDNKIGDRGGIALAQSVPKSQLKVLKLSQNQLTGDAAKKLINSRHWGAVDISFFSDWESKQNVDDRLDVSDNKISGPEKREISQMLKENRTRIGRGEPWAPEAASSQITDAESDGKGLANKKIGPERS